MRNGRDPQDRIGKNQAANDAYERCLADVIELLSTYNQTDEVSALQEAQKLEYSRRTPLGLFVDGTAFMHAELLAKLRGPK